MNSPNLIQLIKAISLTSLVCLSVAGIVDASEATDPGLPDNEQPGDKILESFEEQSNEEIYDELKNDDEIITFIGTKPIGFYRRQSQLAELDFYNKFNDYVTENKFRIKCRKESPLGSRVQQTVCYPQWLLTAIARESNFSRTANLPLPTFKQVQDRNVDDKEAFAKYSEELVNTHPELKAKLIEFGKAKKAYDESKAAVLE